VASWSSAAAGTRDSATLCTWLDETTACSCASRLRLKGIGSPIQHPVVIKFKTTTTTTKNTANEVEPIWVLSGAGTASSGVRPTFKLNSRMQLVLNDPAHDLSVSNQSSDQFMAVLVCGAHDCKLDCVDPGEGKRASCSSSATALRDEEGSCCSGHTAYSTSPTTVSRGRV